MPDGSRKRRHSTNPARRRWYAQHRSTRFCRRFGWQGPSWTPSSRVSFVTRALEVAV
jgi:hypothetical protein